MKHIGLFEGIGGFSLAARWMGWETVAWCEWNPFCKTVLKHHFPDAYQHSDIHDFNGTRYAGKIDIITGGFPCQPFSTAGKRLGTEDDRHLWPEMLRIIREVRPRYVVGENVGGLLSWDEGLVFEQVQTDLEAEGYEVQAFVLPACAVNAPHRRDRVWIVAYTNSIGKREAGDSGANEGCEYATLHTTGQIRNGETVFNSGLCDLQQNVSNAESAKCKQPGDSRARRDGFTDICINAPHPNNKRPQRGKVGRGIERGWQKRHKQPAGCVRTNWENFPTQSPVCSGNDGVPTGLAGITVPRHRRESLKAYGNAIVPQVAYQIFKAIQQIENEP